MTADPHASGTLWQGVWDGAAERLDRALLALLADAEPEVSRSRLKSLVEAGHAAVGGATVREPGRKIKAGDQVSLLIPTPVPATPVAQAMDLQVLYEDAALIVIDKPAGLVVHPAPGNPDHTLVNALIAHCGDGLLGIGGERRPGIVHRLDKETSGVMVAAKTEPALTHLAAQFARHSIDRAYRALVWGVPQPRTGTVAQPIGRDPRERKRMAVVATGRAAVTHYRVLATTADVALVECRLETGRTHQIRVHMAHLGHPLVGDPVYGRRRGTNHPVHRAGQAFGRQALHAVELGFDHPSTGMRLRFISPPPSQFDDLLSGLGLVVPPALEIRRDLA
ncbi:MAG: RluA family pseudouridine synthase [Alphaproteobacteria bacterium]|nr:RluA family pseudouridine synthase [Alphaproteobacteria bacterium]